MPKIATIVYIYNKFSKRKFKKFIFLYKICVANIFFKKITEKSKLTSLRNKNKVAKEFKKYFKTLLNNTIHRSADEIHIEYSTSEP